MRVSVRDGRHFRDESQDEAMSANKKMRGIDCCSKRPQAPKKSRHHACNYLKPGALAQIRDAQMHKHGRKRAAEAEAVVILESVQQQQQQQHQEQNHRQVSHSPERVHAAMAPRLFGPACLQRKKLLAPKFSSTPSPREEVEVPAPQAQDQAQDLREPSPPVVEVPVSAAAETDAAAAMEEFDDVVQSTPEPLERTVADSGSLLESLPLEILVRIVCRLNHNELKPVFHVSKALRYAVMVARQCHFNFTTPGKGAAPQVANQQEQDPIILPFLSEFPAAGMQQLPTPNAPKHAVKAPKPRISMEEMRQIAATLFQGPLSSARLPKLSSRTGASHRVLFNEEELCQAIAQNTL